MRAITTLLLLICTLTATAQTVEQIKGFDSKYYYELYRPYPAEYRDMELTKAPKGYKPFYMSHLARHGSRWHAAKSSYTLPLEILESANKSGELTELGKQLYKDVQRLATDANNRYGELSPLGFEQHQYMAERMVENYPEIFRKKCHIDCKSTTVPRCIHSMASAVREISRRVPTASIRMESSDKNEYLKAYAGLNNVKQVARPLSDSLQRAYLPCPEKFLKRIFTTEQKIDSKEFMYTIFMLNAILGSTPLEGINNLEYAFTEDELAAIWRASNIRRYALTGPSKVFGHAIVEGIYPFVKVFIDQADNAIATGCEQASLRFAHDVTVIPFAAILGIKSCNIVTDDWEQVGHHWRINEVTPMGANIQMVFYRSKRSDEILVKILHNEREQILDSKVATPVESVFYRWSDIREYLLSQIK